MAFDTSLPFASCYSLTHTLTQRDPLENESFWQPNHLSTLLQGKKTNPKKYAVTKYAAIAVVGGLAIGFGSVAATMGNIPLGAFGDLGGDLGGLCGDVFCCECGDICGDCGDCWGGIGGIFMGCFDGIGDCCGSCFDCLGDGCDGIGDLLECMCGCLGDVLSSC